MGQLDMLTGEIDRELGGTGTPEIQYEEQPPIQQEPSREDLRKAVGLKPAQKVQNRMQKTQATKDAESALSGLGMTFDMAKEQYLADNKAQLQLELEEDIKKYKEEASQAKFDFVKSTGKAYARGIEGSLVSAYNGVAEIVNSISSGDVKDYQNGPLPTIDFASRMADLTETERMITDMTQNLVPAVVTAAVPGGVIAKTAAGAIASYAMLDPKQKTLADLAKGTAFEKAAIVGPIIQELQKEDDDTFIEGRLKNVIEYIAPDAVIAGTIKGATKVFAGVKRAHDALKGGATLAEQFPEIEKAAVAESKVGGEAATLEQMQFPGIEAAPQAPIEAIPTPVHQDSVDILAYDMYKFFNPTEQLPLRESRVLDELFDTQGHLKPSAGSGDALFAKMDAGIQSAPSVQVEHNGKIITIAPKSGTKTGEIVATSESGKILASVRLKPEIKDLQKGEFVLAPAMITSAQTVESAGVPIKVLKYIREHIGEVQPSQILTSRGKAFASRTKQRMNKETLAPYVQLAEEIYRGGKAAPTQALQEAVEKEWVRVAGLDTPPVYKTAEGAIAANANNNDLIEAIAKVYDQDPATFTPRGPQTVRGMIAQGKEIADNPEKVMELIQSSAQRPMVAEERVALEMLRERVTEDVAVKIRTALASGNDMELISAKEALDNALKLSTKAQGVMSETGRSLGLVRSLGKLARANDEEALKAIGSVGRNKLREAYIAKYGKDDIQAVLARFDQISKLPDTAFTYAFDEVVRRSKYVRLTDALYTVMVNSYLTPKTVTSIAGSNAIVSAAKVAEQYTQAFTGAITRSPEAVTITEANAFARAMMHNTRSGIQAAWKAAKEGRGSVKFDVSATAMTPEAVAASGFFERVAETGVSIVEGIAYNKVTTAPTRLVMSADAFYKQLIQSAYIESQAVRYQLLAKKAGNTEDAAEWIANFIKKPPEEVLLKANDMAERVTMQRDMSGTFLGFPQDLIERDPTGLARFAFPFLNTRANLVATTVEYLPTALATKEFRNAWNAGGRARHEAMAKVMNGSAFSLAVGGLVANGILELKKDDYKQEQELFEEGKGRLSASLNLYGKSYPIQWLDPLSRAMNVVAAAYPAIVAEESETNRSIMSTTLAVALSTLDDSAFDQLGQLSEIIATAKANDDIGPKIANVFASPMAGATLPLGGTIKQISTLWSPEKGSRVLAEGEREIFDYYMLKLKDTVGYGLPPVRNILGHEVLDPHGVAAIGPFYMNDQKNTRLIESLKQLTDYEENLRRRGFEPYVSFDMPPRELKVDGQSVSLNAQEYDALIVLATNMQLPMARPDGSSDTFTLEQRLTEFMYNEGKHLAQLAVTRTKPEDKELAYMKAVNTINTILDLYYGQAAAELAATAHFKEKAAAKVEKINRARGTPLEPFMRQPGE